MRGMTTLPQNNLTNRMIVAKKSYCIRIGPRFNVDCHPLVTRDNRELKWCGSIRYLGYICYGISVLSQSATTNRQHTEPSMRYLAKLVGQLRPRS